MKICSLSLWFNYNFRRVISYKSFLINEESFLIYKEYKILNWSIFPPSFNMIIAKMHPFAPVKNYLHFCMNDIFSFL